MMKKCTECGTETCPKCGKEKCCSPSGAGPCGAGMIDILAPADARDRTVIFNSGTFNNQWQELYFPIPVTIRPTSYAGGSQNNYSTLQVVSGNLPQATAGVDTPWEVIPAGKAFTLACGHYWFRTDPSKPNIMNYRVYPATVNRMPWISHGSFVTPGAPAVGVASSQIIAARPGRSFLSLDNQSNATMSFAFGPGVAGGGVAAVLGVGVTLLAGESIILTNEDCPEDAVQAIASAAASAVAVQEG